MRSRFDEIIVLPCCIVPFLVPYDWENVGRGLSLGLLSEIQVKEDCRFGMDIVKIA